MHLQELAPAQERPPVGQLLTIKDTCRALALSEWTVRRMIADGTLRVVRIRGSVRLFAEEVERLRTEGTP